MHLNQERPPSRTAVRGDSVRHLDQCALAKRWTISPRTLERWRWLGIGPRYLKIGARVAYALEDVQAFEAAQARRGSSQ